ncbi:2-hydroxyacyl-CoA dehydratase subunit D [Thermodesulfobacteriota bacterium]
MVDLQKKLNEIIEMDKNLPLTAQITDWKKQGGKIIGWVCNYVPEEIIHAAGLLPVRVTGLSKEVPYDDANAYLYTTTCSFVRTCFQMGFDGSYDYLDGFVLASNCDQARRLYDVWDRYLDTSYKSIISVPHVKSPEAVQFFARELSDFKASLEKTFQVTIDAKQLRHSIQVYNEKRDLLRKVNEFRKLDPPPIKGSEALALMNVGNKLSVERFNEILKEIYAGLKSADKNEETSKPRLMISGSCMNNINYLDFIEEQGATVVAEDMCTGMRYWWDKVPEESDQDPLLALSERYLTRFPCARMTPGEDRFEIVVDLAKEYGVDGVIQEMIRYCTPTAWERPWLRRRLEEEGFKVLPLEILYGAEGTGQLKIRVQAFLEMLQMAKGSDYF